MLLFLSLTGKKTDSEGGRDKGQGAVGKGGWLGGRKRQKERGAKR